MKKILSICLSLSVALSMSSVSFADSNAASANTPADVFNEISSDPTNIILYNDGNGNFAFTSTKSTEEKKKLFEEQFEEQAVPEEGQIQPQAWWPAKRITSQDGTYNQVGTVWAQLQTDLTRYAGLLWEDDQVIFSGSSRSMFDGDIRATSISHSDTFSIRTVSAGAEMSGFPGSNPSIGLTVVVNNKSGTITIGKSGSAASNNYIDSYYNNIKGKAYNITRAEQLTSATYMVAGSGITASTSAGESWF